MVRKTRHEGRNQHDEVGMMTQDYSEWKKRSQITFVHCQPSFPSFPSHMSRAQLRRANVQNPFFLKHQRSSMPRSHLRQHNQRGSLHSDTSLYTPHNPASCTVEIVGSAAPTGVLTCAPCLHIMCTCVHRPAHAHQACSVQSASLTPAACWRLPLLGLGLPCASVHTSRRVEEQHE